MATINLDDLMEKAKELADAAGKKTASFMSSQSTNMNASRLSNELKKLYEKLGSTVYKQVKTGGSDNAEIDVITAEIDDRRLRIAEIKDIMAEMTNKKICKSCGATNPKDSVFCAQCGAKLETEEASCGGCHEESGDCCDASCDCPQEEKAEE